MTARCPGADEEDHSSDETGRRSERARRDRRASAPARDSPVSCALPGIRSGRPETSIKLESLNAISADSPAHIARALKDRARDARLRQAMRTGKPRETCPDDQHSRSGRYHHMIVVGKMMKRNHVRQIGTARVFSLLLAAGRRAQAVHLNRVVKRGHAGRNRWTMRREEISKLFDFSPIF